MKITSLFCALGVLVAVTPNLAKSQDNCGYFLGPCGGEGHEFDFSQTNSCFAHTQCRICFAGACHPVCGNCPATFATSATSQTLVQALYAAVERGDVERVMTLAIKLPGYVSFNSARESLQVRSCRGAAVIANLPLRDERQRLLAAHLPTPSQMLATVRVVDLPSPVVASEIIDITVIANAYLVSPSRLNGATVFW